MATVGKTKIASTKGQHYYRFTIRFGKGVEPEYVSAIDLKKYNRAITDPQKEHNKWVDEQLQHRMTALLQQYNNEDSATIAKKSSELFLTHWEWVAETRGANNQKTWAGYNSALKHFRKFLSHKGYPTNITCSKIDKAICIEFKAYVVGTATNLRNDNELSLSSRYTIMRNFFQVLNDAVDNDKMHRRPHKGIPLPEQGDTDTIYLTKEEIKKLEDTHYNNHTIKNAFLFACFTGLRGGDIATIKWKNLNETKNGTELDILTSKKKIRVRFVIPQQALKYLPPRGEDDHNIFRNFKWDGATNPKLKTFVALAGITKNVTAHTARHSFAVYQLKNNVTLYHLSKMLGHKSVNTTEKHYAQFAKTDLDAIILKNYKDW